MLNIRWMFSSIIANISSVMNILHIKNINNFWSLIYLALSLFFSGKPEISIIPFAASRILTGSSLTYACEGTLGTLAWFKENKGSSIELPSPSLLGVSITSSFQKGGRMRKEVTISNADSSHIGMYECRLNYKGKTMQRSVQVDVRGKVIITMNNNDCYDYRRCHIIIIIIIIIMIIIFNKGTQLTNAVFCGAL